MAKVNINIPIKDCVIDMYRPVLQDVLAHKHTHYVGKGGRGSTKSSFFGGICIPLLIVNNPGVHAVVFRKIGNTIQTSTFAQVVWGIYQLGLESLFHIPKTYSTPIVYLPTGQKILFMGLDDPNKVKSIKLPFGYIGITWFEELDQFAGEAEIRKVLQSTMRGGKLFWDFRTFNPPISKLNWANQYAEQAEIFSKDTTLVVSNTYLDVPVEWLGEQFFQEANELKMKNERAYTHEYLGVPTGTGGDVFPNVDDFDSEELVDLNGNMVPKWTTFDKIYNGIDWGYAKDPFRFVRMYFDPKRLDLYIFREYNTLKTRNEVVFHELYDELQLVDREEQVIADSAEEKSIADFKAYGAFIRGAQKGPESVRYGIKWLQGLNHIFIDKRKCPLTYFEFSTYEYEQDREGNFISSYPDANNHSIDACLTGDTKIYTVGGYKRIADLVDTEDKLFAYDTKSKSVIVTDYIHCRQTRTNAQVWKITLENDAVVECTYDHKILTTWRGYVEAHMLLTSDTIVCIYGNSKIKSIESTDRYETVYDLEVPETHNFILDNGVVVHNCRYALEKYCNRKGN